MKAISAALLTAWALTTLPSALAQEKVVSLASPKTITAKQGAAIQVPLSVTVAPGYHVNSNAPTDPYLIGLRLTWSPGPLEGAEIRFPEAQTEKFGFSETPISVFAGEFQIVTKFKVAENAPPGLGLAAGKLRYQACNDRMCLPPKTLEVDLPVEITR